MINVKYTQGVFDIPRNLEEDTIFFEDTTQRITVDFDKSVDESLLKKIYPGAVVGAIGSKSGEGANEMFLIRDLIFPGCLPQSKKESTSENESKK